MNHSVKGLINISFLFFVFGFFQHESLSVKMFNHLVAENKLDKEFEHYFGKNLAEDKHKEFITEMIEGPPKTESKVQECVL